MATVTAWIPKQTTTAQVVGGLATIDSGETATLAIPCGGRALVRLGIPSAFTGTTLTFTVQAFRPADATAPTLSPPFRVLTDEAGNTVTATVSANKILEIPELKGAYAFTIVSGTSEGAAREIEVQCIGQNPTSGGDNNLTIEGGSITANQGTQGSTASPWFVEPVGTSSTGPLLPNAAALADGATVPTATEIGSVGLALNGTTTDLIRNNIKVTLAASAARTTTLTVSTQTNYNGAMLHVIISVSAYTTGGLTPVINGIGNLGTSYALLTGAKISSAGTTVLKIGPGFATTVNQAAADMLPRSWNVVVTPDDATSITYSVEGNINE